MTAIIPTYPAESDRFFEVVDRFFAHYDAQQVEIDVNTVRDGTVIVRGDFGQAWTHGGYAPRTSKRVPIAALSDKHIVTA